MTEFTPSQPRFQRLFFALWPDKEQRQQLAAYFPLLNRCGGRRVYVEKLHLTLAFLGSVDEATRDCLEQAADDIRIPPFTLQLDQIGFWRRPQVVWLGTEDIPVELGALVGELKKAMVSCELEPETRSFQAHLTLIRRARQAPRELAPPKMDWPVREFALVASETLPGGVRYEVLRRWELKER